MGIFSRSSSSSSTTNNTDARTVNAAQNGSVSAVAGQGNSSFVQILDGGAIRDSFSFAKDSLDFSGGVSDSAFSLAGDAVYQAGDNLDKSLNFGSESLQQSFEFGAGSLDAAFDFSTKIAEQSSLENRAILNAAINNAADSEARIVKFAGAVASPQNTFVKYGVVAIVILALASVMARGK